MDTKVKIDRRLLAAQGYAELGMFDDAMSELESLPAAMQQDAGVLRVWLSIYMSVHRWEKGLEVSLTLCQVFAEDTFGFIHAAFCLHELGRTAEAKASLLAGPSALLDEATYHYNLACYDAVLGNIEDAQAHLRASFKLDGSFRKLARTDPDLKTVWSIL